MTAVVTQIRGTVWLPVDSEDGDAVDTGITVERSDSDEIALTLAPNYEAKALNIWIDRAGAAALVAEIARALAEPEA
jgi:hypothetical protein